MVSELVKDYTMVHKLVGECEYLNFYMILSKRIKTFSIVFDVQIESKYNPKYVFKVFRG